MRWKKYAPWLALAALLLLLFFYNQKTAAWQFREEPLQRIQLSRQDSVRAEIRFPALTLSGHRQAKNINRQLNELRLAKLDAYREWAEQRLDEAEFNDSLPQEQLYCYVDANFSVFCGSKLYLSLVLNEYEHIYDAPHPMIRCYGYSFDSATGQRLTLEDIWGEGAREKAAAEIYAQIELEGRTGDYFPDLRENLLSNLGEENWYVDDENLYIIYNPYEIAAYAMGVQEFKLRK